MRTANKLKEEEEEDDDRWVCAGAVRDFSGGCGSEIKHSQHRHNGGYW